MSRIIKPRDIGVLVKNKRKQKKISQSELAEICGVGRRFISELENGKKESYDLGLALRVLNRMGFELKLIDKENNNAE